jgi:hypothetical protein
MMGTRRAGWTGVLLVMAIVGGCATGTERAPSGEPGLVLPAELVIMPVGDDRDPRENAVDVTREVRNAASRILAKRGYVALARDEIAPGAVPAPRNLSAAQGRDLAPLGPRDSGALVFVAVTGVEEGYDYGGDNYVVKVVGVVVDPVTSRILWKSTGFGRTSLGGFMRIFAPQSSSYDAVYDAVKNLFRTLPRRDAKP